ncbi:hypothetical protein EVAR_49399_1 [Eumeta japonica]|uniref:RNase H type-1 domain-containing protein n=1 Tax=Eumeta variegata TaxID=151549 RepID=A0A4C1Y4A8_EUMVA|nr:hypothetical protein EVAR_49399_1 [Eumeta japonica]
MTLELIAISKALAYAESDNWDKIVICSDSKSAIRHLARCASVYRGVPTAFCVLTQLLHFKLRNVRVKLRWVPSHIGISGNEETDRLANAEHLSGIECPVRHFGAMGGGRDAAPLPRPRLQPYTKHGHLDRLPY